MEKTVSIILTSYTRVYPNTVKGIKRFIGSLSVTGYHCVMEATGNYGFLLFYLLERQGIAASMVNPKQIKHFSRMMLAVTKTGTKDACMIAMYGEKMNPPAYKMPSGTIMLLKQKKTIVRQLKKQLIKMDLYLLIKLNNSYGGIFILIFLHINIVREFDELCFAHI